MIYQKCLHETVTAANFCPNCGASFNPVRQNEIQGSGNTSDISIQNTQGVVVGDNAQLKIINQGDKQDVKSLRQSYHNWVFENASYLSLAGIDRKAASDSETRISLSAVYTALLTTTSVGQQISSDVRAEMDQQPRLLSTMAQLDQYPHLVLLGDPGSGKSIFVNFVAICLAGEALGRNDINLKLLT
jgi:predicted NACHT family NTPase